MKLETFKKCGKLKNANYCLKPNLNIFEINKVYMSTFFKSLWNYPEAVYYILKISDYELVEKDLASFFMNNFYNNFISENSIENNLLYVIAMILKEEIDNMKEIPQINTFLENSKASFLLKEMINFPDVQLYFKKIILQMFEKMENNYSWKKMEFDLSLIHKDMKEFIENENKKSSKKNKKTIDEICNKFINTKLSEQCMNNIEEIDLAERKSKKLVDLDDAFLENTTNLKKEEIEECIKKAETNNNPDLKSYYTALLDNINSKKSDNLYFNVILEKFTSDKDINLNYLLYLYQHDFNNVISLLDIFFEDLMNNISLVPESIRYICKMISILIKNKYKDIPKYLECAFISKFFVDKLLIPIIKKPCSNALINDFIISKNSTDNMKNIIYILMKIFSGKLFQINSILPDNINEKNLTLFNRYIMNSMEKVFNFYENTINITLPSLIDNYINNLLPLDFTYDYFKENPDEIYAHISICFNINTLINIINVLKKGENELFSVQNNKNTKLKRIFNKMKYDDKLKEILYLDNKAHIDASKNLIKSDKDDKNKSTKNLCNIIPSVNYYIFNESEIGHNYENIFKINNKISGFYIDIKKIEKEKKLEEKEKNLIKFKNYLINSLKTYKALKKSSFKSIESINIILSQIKTFMANSYLNNNIPSNWSISSVLDYMKKIPEEYKENDYEKCFEELTQSINQSIEEFDFGKLIMLKKNFEPIDKMHVFYLKKAKIIKDMDANKKVKNFIEEYFLPVEMKFYYDQEEKKFEIKRKPGTKEKSLKNGDVLEIIKNEKIIVRTISSFIRNFPDLNKYQDVIGVTPFQMMKELEINKKLIDYFEIIAPAFIQENYCTEDEYDKIYDIKIKNFIMNKIYKKIYPKELEYEDSIFFEKTMHLSWVEPSMIIKGDTSLDALDNLLPDILQEFKNLNASYSPFEKFQCIKKIFELIGIIVKFNDDGEGGGKEIGAEDITPYLNFVLIRACPIKIFTDIKFIKFFLKDEGMMEYDFLNVEAMCKSIMESTYKDFNVSQSEYIKNCNNTIYNKNGNDKRFNEIINRFESVGNAN